jgi:mannose-6-phosphate isomerase-like protein (cupin superfamily)
MPRAGDMIENTLTGERAVFVSTGGETAGRLLEADYFLRPGGYVAAAHVHPLQVETFEVREGSVKITIGRKEVTAVPGGRYAVPRGVAHRIVNHTTEPARLFSTLEPALRSDELLETVWGLATDGRTNSRGYPSLLQAAATGMEFRDELRLARPPRWVQDLVFTVLAPLARARSYTGAYIPEARRKPPEP